MPGVFAARPPLADGPGQVFTAGVDTQVAGNIGVFMCASNFLRHLFR